MFRNSLNFSKPGEAVSIIISFAKDVLFFAGKALAPSGIRTSALCFPGKRLRHYTTGAVSSNATSAQ